MSIKKRKIIMGIFIVSVMAIIALPLKNELVKRYWWNKAAEASASMPYQIGLTHVVIIPCFTTGVPPICEGGTLCFTKDAGTCTLYSDVSGVPAGGKGSEALFLKTALVKAGVMPGGQLIAGGMSLVLMDSGVLAGRGGCYGCR